MLTCSDVVERDRTLHLALGHSDWAELFPVDLKVERAIWFLMMFLTPRQRIMVPSWYLKRVCLTSFRVCNFQDFITSDGQSLQSWHLGRHLWEYLPQLIIRDSFWLFRSGTCGLNGFRWRAFCLRFQTKLSTAYPTPFFIENRIW